MVCMRYTKEIMAHYEIEIKSLLGSTEARDELLNKMKELDSALSEVGRSSQLNHYFEGGDVQKLKVAVMPLFSAEQQEKLEKIITLGSDFSVRTRQKNDEVLLVLKAALDGGTSSNAVSRLEFEEPVAMALGGLDALVQSAGFIYQAKWSRDRVEYNYKDITVCIDRNAGYGYLAEFEGVTSNETETVSLRNTLESIMTELGVDELPQDRLARMFDFYNQNWAEYYGTEKVFTVEW